jgi:hypothetical protein
VSGIATARPIVTPVEVGGVRMTRADSSNNAQGRDECKTHTFGEIGSEILVQLVEVSFGYDSRIQRRVGGALVRRTLCLEVAGLIAGDSRIGGGGWRRGCAGSARRPLHDAVLDACDGERGGGRGRRGGIRTTMDGKADEMRRPFSVNTLHLASIGDFDQRDSMLK